jgi:hypothetical protein
MEPLAETEYKTPLGIRLANKRWKAKNREHCREKQAEYNATYQEKHVELLKLCSRLSARRIFHKKKCGCDGACVDYIFMAASHKQMVKDFRANE